MNIPDRAGLYRELRRVLKPGGRLAFYDPISADGHPAVIYPVPWAQTPETSTLLTADEMCAVLSEAGFDGAVIDDVTADALGWAAQGGPPQPGGINTTMIVGARMAEMAANFGTNLKAGSIRLATGIAAAAA